MLTDVKTSAVGRFRTPADAVPPEWLAATKRALESMELGDKRVEQLLVDAWDRGEVYLRQLEVDRSPAGSGRPPGKLAVQARPIVRLV